MKTVALIVATVIIGLIVHRYAHMDYSKPWWKGSEYQRVCAIDQPSGPNRQCYSLMASSDGNTITAISFPNGGYITPSNVSCDKAADPQMYDTDRFCTIIDQEGRQWEVDHPNNQ